MSTRNGIAFTARNRLIYGSFFDVTDGTRTVTAQFQRHNGRPQGIVHLNAMVRE